MKYCESMLASSAISSSDRGTRGLSMSSYMCYFSNLLHCTDEPTLTFSYTSSFRAKSPGLRGRTCTWTWAVLRGNSEVRGRLSVVRYQCFARLLAHLSEVRIAFWGGGWNAYLASQLLALQLCNVFLQLCQSLALYMVWEWFYSISDLYLIGKDRTLPQWRDLWIYRLASAVQLEHVNSC